MLKKGNLWERKRDREKEKERERKKAREWEKGRERGRDSFGILCTGYLFSILKNKNEATNNKKNKDKQLSITM